MQVIFAILILLGMALYVIPNVMRYPWHALVFVAAGIALITVMHGHERLLARLNGSAHPGARRVARLHATISGLIAGSPPYDAGRWWLARSVVQLAYYGFMLLLGLSLIVALGGVFTWLDSR